MAIYIQLLTLTPDGREKSLRDALHIRHAEQAIDAHEVEMLGVYGVLGAFDYVILVDAPNNEAAARFSMELGVRAGAHVTTLPAIPIGRLDPGTPQQGGEALTERRLELPREGRPTR